MQNFIRSNVNRFQSKADDFKKSATAEMVDFDAFAFRVRAFGIDGADIYLSDATAEKWYSLVCDFCPLARYYNCKVGLPFNIYNDNYAAMLVDYLSIEDAYIQLEFNGDSFSWNVNTFKYRRYFMN
jgi:hypothetical protein